MKKSLSDYIKSREEFERFCNIFLKEEVSSLVKVYEVPGPDGGIDAEYDGPYAGKEGRWVFQCKYRDPTNESSSRSSIISAMKGDGRKKEKNGELDKADGLKCDHYVLVTNIRLTAGNVDKIRNIKTERGYTFSLHIWDAEDLMSITLAKFPYLLKPPHRAIFSPWHDMFRDEVAGKKPLLRYDYKTFGRESEIRHFRDFIQDSDKRLLVMYGSGGIGKTKLAIECAKTVEQDYKDYDPLFIRVDTSNFENALKDILPNRKYIFFIDDAHDFVSNFGNLKQLLNDEAYRESKAVLITRNQFKTSVKGFFLPALPDGAVDEREVLKLPREKTKEFIQKHVKESLPEGSLLAGLTRIGRDTPLIAVMVIDALNNGRDLKNLTETALIEHLFESYLPEPDNPRRRLLNWLSGIAPIDVENHQVRDKLAELLKIESYEVEWYRDDLLKAGLLLQSGRKQRVFPDPLSDYILGRVCLLSNQRLSSFHERLLKEFLPILPVNVITNLARVENATGENSLLDVYVSSLKSQALEGDNFVREDILDQMEGISYFRLDDATDIFNIILDTPKEDSVKHYTGWTSTRTHQDVVKKIAAEAQKTVNTLSGFTKTLEIVRKLLLIDDLELPNYDSPQELLKRMTGFQTSKPSVFQTKALEEFEVWKTEDKPELSLALLNALDTLLMLDFNETVSQGGSLEFGWHHLKYTPQLTQLRSKAIELIENCLITSQCSTVRAEAIGSISQAINPLESPFRHGMSEEDQVLLQKEQERLFNILADQISKETDFTVLNAIDQCLHGYAENRHVNGFPKERATELLAKFHKHESYEGYLFYRQFTGKFRDWDLSENPEQTQAFLKKYLKKYTPPELSKLMQQCITVAERGKEHRSTRDSIWAEKGWNPGTATSLLQSIAELNPSYGSDLLDQIVAWRTEESHCASGLLSGIRYVNKDKASEATQRLLDQNTTFGKHIAAKSYLSRNKTDGCIGKEDLSILDQLSETPDELLRRYIAESLPNFYAVDANIVLEILVKLSSDKSPIVMRQVLRTLTRQELKFSPQNHLKAYKQVMLNCVRLEHLDDDAEQALHVIFRHDPIWVIEFFEKRIAYKENEVKRYDSFSDRPPELLKFDAVPHRPHYLFENVDWNDQNALSALRRVRDWVLTSSNLLRFEAPNLLTSMVAGNDPHSDEIKINGAMRKLFEEWIDSEDIELMRDAAYLMRRFDTDAVFYSLAESLLIRSNLDEQVKSEITAALWTEGHSKNIGQPSPYFQKRIKELETWRDRTQLSDVAKFADDLIEITQREIKRESEEDEEFLDAEGY